MEHYWGTITGRRGNLEAVCMPDETCEPGCCSSRSNYHPAKRDSVCPFQGRSADPSLYNFSIDFSLLEPLGGFHFPGTGVLHFKLAIYMRKMSVSGECTLRRVYLYVCVCVPVFNGQVDKHYLELSFCAEYWWLASLTSPTDDIQQILCAWSVCVFMSVPYRETSCTFECELWRMYHCVLVCDSPLSFSVCRPRGESCWWHCPGSRAAEPALGWILCPVGRQAGMAGLPGKGTHTYMSTSFLRTVIQLSHKVQWVIVGNKQSQVLAIDIICEICIQRFVWYLLCLHAVYSCGRRHNKYHTKCWIIAKSSSNMLC